MSPLLQFAIEAAYKAGRSTLAHFQVPLDVERKGDDSPVTIADRGAERLIREEIAKRYPEHGIYGEEEGKTGDQSRRWVIDPIDGTKSFVSGVPLYATLLAFEEDEQAIVGVCYFPALDEMIVAERGQGASWNGRSCSVSNKANLADAVICSASPKGLRDYGKLEGTLRLADRTLAHRTWCDAYGHALVATGRVEAMLDPVVNRYDVAPLALILEEAGGRFTDFQGRPGVWPEALSTNAALHDEILEAFRG